MRKEDIERMLREEKSRLESERERLLEEFHRKFKCHDPRENKPFDISDLMHEQYITRQQAQKWSDIEGDAGLNDLKSILNLCKEKCPDLKKVKSVVDYGCGSGRKSALIYLKCNPEQNEESGRLHLLDLSYEIIRNARDYCTNTAEIKLGNLPWSDPVAFQNVGELTSITNDSNYKLHLFTGQTIGNFKNPIEILRRISLNVRKREHLLVEWFSRKPENYKKPQFEELYRFLFLELGYPLEAIGNYNPHLETDEQGREWNVMSFTVQDVPEEQRNSDSLDLKYGEKHTLPSRTDIIVSRSQRFKEDEVVRLCEKAGLEGMILQESSTSLEVWAGDVPRIEKEVHRQKWVASGDRRYGLFKKKGPAVMPRIIAAGAIALVGLVGGYIVSQPEQPRPCIYEESAYNTLACVDKESREKFETYLADVSIDGTQLGKEREKESNGLLVSIKGKRYYLTIEDRIDVRGRLVLQNKINTVISVREAMKRSDGTNCNGAVLRYLNEGPKGSPEELLSDLDNLLAFQTARYLFFADCSGGNERIAIDSEALFQLYTAAGGYYNHFSSIYFAEMAEKLFESVFRKDNEATQLLIRSFADSRVLEIFKKIGLFNFNERYDKDTLLGLNRGKEINDSFILKLKTPPWYKLEFERDFTSQKHISHFIEKIARSKSELVLNEGINFIEVYGNNLPSLVENGAVLGALIRASDYVQSEVYADLIKLGTRMVAVPNASNVLMYLVEVADKIQQDSSSPIGTNVLSDATSAGKIFVSLIESLNQTKFLDVLSSTFYRTLRQISSDEGLLDYLDDFSLLTEIITKHACVQERLSKIYAAPGSSGRLKFDANPYFQQIADLDLFSKRFREKSSVLINPFRENEPQQTNANSNSYPKRIKKIDNKDFPYEYGLCQREN